VSKSKGAGRWIIDSFQTEKYDGSKRYIKGETTTVPVL